ncbi:hypothetical protein F4810DRAFT_684117 [Camillea tinctor]|nr:hypothetical protein F4810DRAFT_684117 [Camillea tinctor]
MYLKKFCYKCFVLIIPTDNYTCPSCGTDLDSPQGSQGSSCQSDSGTGRRVKNIASFSNKGIIDTNEENITMKRRKKRRPLLVNDLSSSSSKLSTTRYNEEGKHKEEQASISDDYFETLNWLRRLDEETSDWDVQSDDSTFSTTCYGKENRDEEDEQEALEQALKARLLRSKKGNPNKEEQAVTRWSRPCLIKSNYQSLARVYHCDLYITVTFDELSGTHIQHHNCHGLTIKSNI